VAGELQFQFRGKVYDDPASGLAVMMQALNQGMIVSGKVLNSKVRAFLERTVEEIIRRNSASWPDGTTGTSVSRRSGALADSLRQGIKVTGTTLDSIRGEVTGIFYLGLQEFGGTLKADSGSYLAIPLPAALDGSGMPLKPSPRDWDGTFVATTKAGNLVIFRKDGTQLVPLYVLKTSVRVPARLGATQEFRRQIPYFMSQVIDTLVAELTR
jgi:hypothetical protein